MKNQIQTASEVKHSSNASTEAHETRKNKKGLAMFLMTVTNQSGAMESDTISINGRSSKSQTSRGKFLTMKNIRLFFVLSVCTFFFACSSPEKDGKKVGKEVAKKYCDCYYKYHDTRRENKEAYSNCINKAKKNYYKALEKYKTNKQKLSEFNYAFWETFNTTCDSASKRCDDDYFYMD